MIKNFMVVLALCVSCSAYAENVPTKTPAAVPQVQEIGMPDGTVLRGFVQNGVFIPLQPMNQLPQAKPAAAPPAQGVAQPQAISAAIQLDQNQNQNIKTDANVNQNINSNSRNVYKEEHDTVGAITKIGGMIFQGIGMMAR